MGSIGNEEKVSPPNDQFWKSIQNHKAAESILGEAQKHAEGHKLRAHDMKDASAFDRNLEEVLDQRRSSQNLAALHRWDHAVDFSSNDFLSLATNGILREEFLKELSRNPEFKLGSTGSRLLDGNSPYSEALEQEIAEFHGGESALLVASGYDANCAIFCAIPRPGDVIVYDELIHASVQDGMKYSLTESQISFRHNDPTSFRDVLDDIEESHPLVRKGQRCVLVSVESVYSMDGDVCPLQALVEIAKEVFPKGNVEFVVDEAHSTGLMGVNGRGLVCDLGLEKEIAIRLHTFGKGMSTTGAAILSNKTVQNMLLNFARPLIYTTAPSFPMLAAIKAGYTLLRTGQLTPLRENMQRLVKHFYDKMTADPEWAAITKAGTCSIPLLNNWEGRDYITQFVPVWTREKYNYFLSIHLLNDNFSAIPINPPVVPRGTGRVRLIIHAGNTDEQVEELANSILTWAKEMYAIETGKTKGRLPAVAQKLQLLMSASGHDISPRAGNPFME
ncbi:Pyridoxal phosphate-dependent transferase, major domain [Lecanosticta acicola]|uniref:Pyridoxal phosphate-dependent transferase, major domain, partial n=1 Tax=Lecanosticta acicola TaxID=111012 RepID=A0AAI8YXV4_9PEZI|nr:Pyridoxal phosphate-dependent transferase, major domain [Lecanosticta acicola]